MDVVLVIPPTTSKSPQWTDGHLGIGYLSAVLRQGGHIVHTINCQHRDFSATRTLAQLQEIKPALIGISAMFNQDFSGLYRLVRSLRARNIDSHINVGGHATSFLYQVLLQEIQEIDSITVGEGELVILELVEALEREKGNWRAIPGLAYRGKRGSVTLNPLRPMLGQLDELPFPHRDVLAAIPPHERDSLRIAIMSSRGCYARCTFCSVRPFYELAEGKPWRARSPINVVDEICTLAEEYGVKSFYFADDTFVGPGKAGRRRAAAIAEEILRRRLRIRFSFGCRVDEIDHELFQLLGRAGLDMVTCGVESGVQRALDTFGKQTTVEQNRRALRILSELDITYNDIGFIMFDPYSTFEEIKENRDFIKEVKLDEDHAHPYFVSRRMAVYPGSPIEKQLEDEGRLTRKALRLTDGYDEYHRYYFEDRQVERAWMALDHAARRIEGQYFVITGLEKQWSDWVRLIAKLTRIPYDELLTVPMMMRELAEKMQKWRCGAGCLALQILEETIGILEDQRILADTTLLQTKQRAMELIDEYDSSQFGVSFDEFRQKLLRRLHSKQIEFTKDHIHYVVDLDLGLTTTRSA